MTTTTQNWQTELARAIRNPDELLRRLELSWSAMNMSSQACQQFPLLVPESYLARMEMGNPRDPLLLQVLPTHSENIAAPGFEFDALRESDSHIAPGLLQKYPGRALMIATGACAIHCRYCFRRHYPYQDEPRRLEEWQPAFEAIQRDASIREVLLSGGDPLTLSDRRLRDLFRSLNAISHVDRIRIHTRLPIVLPSRITQALIDLIRESRATPLFVVHANHPREITGDCAATLKRMSQAGITLLNQSVLLKDINDNADVLEQLSLKLVNLGILPYYLHQLDRVRGTAHFEVVEDVGKRLISELRKRLPGYAVPQYVREIPEEFHKVPLL
ncbi:MAG: EF-P beta-lysylation protein EpmB [Planctomycetaceae bacterium]